MDGTVFMGLFVICAILTGLITEFIKGYLKRFNNNIIAVAVGLVVGLIVGFAYAGIEGDFSSHTELGIVVLALTSGFGAMYGYDKIYEAIKGQKKIDEEDEEDGSN